MAEGKDDASDIDSEAPQEEMICIHVHVHGPEGEKVIPVPCGSGPQTIKWLGHVGIARYDEKEYQGWVKLGVPTKVTNEGGRSLDLDRTISDVQLKDKQHVWVESSMFQMSQESATEKGATGEGKS